MYKTRFYFSCPFFLSFFLFPSRFFLSLLLSFFHFSRLETGGGEMAAIRRREHLLSSRPYHLKQPPLTRRGRSPVFMFRIFCKALYFPRLSVCPVHPGRPTSTAGLGQGRRRWRSTSAFHAAGSRHGAHRLPLPTSSGIWHVMCFVAVRQCVFDRLAPRTAGAERFSSTEFWPVRDALLTSVPPTLYMYMSRTAHSEAQSTHLVLCRLSRRRNHYESSWCGF